MRLAKSCAIPGTQAAHSSRPPPPAAFDRHRHVTCQSDCHGNFQWRLGSCTLATLTRTRSDVLADGMSYAVITLTLDVAVNVAAPLTNTASVSGGGEIDTGNDSVEDVANVMTKTTPLTLQSFTVD